MCYNYYIIYSLSYSVECPQLWTPSATAWPIAESHQPAAAGYSLCHPHHHYNLSSPPTVWDIETKKMYIGGKLNWYVKREGSQWMSARVSYRRLVSSPHQKEADFEVTFSPWAGVIWVVQQKPLPHYTMGCKTTHMSGKRPPQHRQHHQVDAQPLHEGHQSHCIKTPSYFDWNKSDNGLVCANGNDTQI